MQIYFGDPARFVVPPCALVIGNFDGVHIGHQNMLMKLKIQALKRQLSPALLTFEPHPREFFACGTPPGRLSTLRDKLSFLRQLGRLDYVFVYRFNTVFSRMLASRFIDDILVSQLKTRYLITGDDFQFGADRLGNVALLAQHTGFVTEVLPAVMVGGERVSSSLIRQRLRTGELESVKSLLGRPYQLSGRVMHGRKLGRTLGFPTANVHLPLSQPALEGIFVVEVETQFGQFWGIASLGKNPTVSASHGYKLEVHLFDFTHDLYGQRVTVSFLKKLRDEVQYVDLSQLEAQIHRDALAARSYLNML